MPRPRKCCRISENPKVYCFKPRGVPMCELEEITLSSEEFEALRLKYTECMEQIEAAKAMEVSQSTFARILNRANQKVTTALVKGYALNIEKKE